VLAGQLAHERTLAHRREANETDTGNTCAGDIESDTSPTAAATAGLQQFSLEFREFCLQLS
jgi:hypothetical protein